MFIKDTYSQRRLEKLFHREVLGVVDFEALHERIRSAIRQAKVLNAKFSVSYTIRESEAEGQGWMSYTIKLTGNTGFFFKRSVSAHVQFESICLYEEPVQVEASTEIKETRNVFETTTLYQTYIGQGRGKRTMPGTDHLV
jgi:hypothetical protein